MDLSVPTKKFALLLSYLGTNYHGWQRQSKSEVSTFVSIQETIEKILSEIVQEKVSLVGSGRTDSGVHALGQVAHFKVHHDRFTPEIIKKALNSQLPSDIRVIQAYEAPRDFHAQHAAVKKQYTYTFFQGPCALPLYFETSWWIQKELNVSAMNEAAKMLLGEHDFLPFQASGAKPGRTTVREILEAEVVRLPLPEYPGQDLNGAGFSLVRVRLVGTGFLKQMVRGIAGTLLQIGENRRPAADMADILVTLDRKKVGPTAPAKGLTLERVWYKPNAYGNSSNTDQN